MYNPINPISHSQYTQSIAQKPKRKINLKPLFISLIFIGLYILTIILSTFLASFSENIDQLNLTTTFDPIITIAYILVFYSVSFYYSLTKKQAYNYLLLALFLSFTINFVEGAMILVFLAPILRKLKLIESQTQQ
ncbi:hypothetical protein A2572_02875 [Candidatus Collierbacteria bacterium RIFOXYD1_FULL_40_9]|uniref:Uncharacterized protein n=1 Tax=Candidatus Collierbacteria bacterium RIFOXYD1_FULL_40_9 TaxID=1817731 RepID=A0A1F5FU12_9BACT|nr:MAG: hypothetical protein A2572_02875 [Candidatus Collierbacteria bacterium RIFOXYD1_FULL_40_9]